jgi:IS30 family transposase
MGYKQLSFEQRCTLAAYWKAGYMQKNIALEMNVHPSTVSRELARNQRWNGRYSPEQAGCFYQSRRIRSRRPKTFTLEIQNIVREKLLLDWSPEQISGYGKLYNLFSISHERIYQYVLADKKAGGKLYLHLRHGKKRYRKRYGSAVRTGPIKNRVMIDERPSIVNDKKRLGDWEIDTIIGKQHSQAIVTLVERISKKTLIGMVGTKHADFVANQVIQLLTPLQSSVFTITADNGSEFAKHEFIAKALEANIYFAHPYHSWERGLNENTNGLIRQYIPKGKDFTEVSYNDILSIQNLLNSRPRKSLGFATPDEVFNRLQREAIEAAS